MRLRLFPLRRRVGADSSISDRSRAWQESNRHLRARSSSTRLPPSSTTVNLSLVGSCTIQICMVTITDQTTPGGEGGISSLTRELEKKFSDRHVLILASRRILPRPRRSNRSRTTLKQKRPRSRTLTAVHEAILNDLVFPVEIVGKRVRTREDGSKLMKVVLDEKERGGVDYRLDTYSEVYRRLTGRTVVFEFPVGAQVEY